MPFDKHLEEGNLEVMNGRENSGVIFESQEEHSQETVVSRRHLNAEFLPFGIVSAEDNSEGENINEEKVREELRAVLEQKGIADVHVPNDIIDVSHEEAFMKQNA